MKNMKKILALVVAMLLVLGMTAALADVSLTVSNPVAGHTYYYYQLFTGDLATNGKLSNVKWGSDVKTSEITYNTDKKVTPVAGAEVPQEVLDYFATLASKTSTDAAQDTADIISAFVTGEGHEISSNTQVPTGYYVIKDSFTDETADQTTTLSTNIVAVVNSTAITPKAGTTEHHKYVLDVNDTTDTKIDLTNLKNVESGWDKTADHDIGDHVPFKLDTTIASDFGKYDTYYLAVTDTLHDGLVLDQESIEVYVNGVEATEGSQDATDGTYYLSKDASGFKVEFKDLKKNTNAEAERHVVIYYTATLGETSVVIGNPGNLNESYAEYSNNPNDDQTGDNTSRTPTDTAVVFTFKTDVDKVDPAGNDLPNAGFTLYKKVKTADAIPSGKTNVAGTTPAGAKSDTFPSGEFWYAVKTITAGEGTNFEFKGIDDGTYKLVESETPEGYNTMDPITLVVEATHGDDAQSTTKYSVSVLNDGNDSFASDPKGGTITFDRKKADDKTLSSGEIYSEIVNNEGTTLPSTGGIGTTILYVGGSILVILAAILLITKRRMSSEE